MLQVNIKKQLPDYTLDIEFCIENKVLVLFGNSGCGKTTTLRCITGLTKPDEGYIAYNNTVFFSSKDKIDVPPFKRNIGYMFQDLALFPHMNVRKNILYGAKNAEELYNLIHLLKIPHLIDRSVRYLSGGEKQRVALARALMAGPNALLLDEPLSALDQETRIELQYELKRIQLFRIMPFILVTHDREEARTIGDEIIFMEKGQIVSRENVSRAV